MLYEDRHGSRIMLLQIMYVAFIIAGAVALFFPSQAVENRVPSWAVFVWASFFLVGGISCSIGLWLKHWLGELAGLPLLVSSALLYGVAVAAQYDSPSPGRSDGAFLFVGALLIAEALGLFERWIALWRLLRIAARVAAEEDQ